MLSNTFGCQTINHQKKNDETMITQVIFKKINTSDNLFRVTSDKDVGKG